MSRVAALVAIVLTAVVALLLPAAFPAGAPQAAARDRPAQQPAQQPVAPVRLDVGTMTPRVVTSAGPGELVVTGTVTNTGPGIVDDLAVRVQRGPVLAGEAALRAALAGEAAVDDATPPFADLGPLAPGASVPFRYAVPLTGPPQSTLALPGPGTYPLLVNLNGTVDGTPSRLAGVRTMLPVSSLPGAAPPSSPQWCRGPRFQSATRRPTCLQPRGHWPGWPCLPRPPRWGRKSSSARRHDEGPAG